jgi:hypothetical protein
VPTNWRFDDRVWLIARCWCRDVAARADQQQSCLSAPSSSVPARGLTPDNVRAIAEAPCRHDSSACGNIGVVAHRNSAASSAAGMSWP